MKTRLRFFVFGLVLTSVVSGLLLVSLPRPAARAQRQDAPPSGEGLRPIVTQAVGFAVTQPVRDMEPSSKPSDSMRRGRAEANEERPQKPIRQVATDVTPDSDAALQQGAQATDIQPSISAPISTFEGLSNQDNQDVPAIGGRVFPPDTVGDVGPTQYVQAVNLLFRVFDKATGAPQTAPLPISALFTSVGGRCSTSDNGDPIVLYDSYADRWIITQFVVSSAAPLGQCFAVSQTGDAAGAYYAYDFVYPVNKFNDYPKFGVWPDGYYWTANQFTLPGVAPFLGVGVGAFNREKVLRGDPTAEQIFFDLQTTVPAAGGLLPADADGLAPPPAGAPNIMSFFTANEFGDPEGDGLRLFAFDADFANPAGSTFTELPFVPVAAFNPLDPAGADDIEQPSPAPATAYLDAISDRLMHRLQYRNFGGYEALTVNHTVNVGTGTTPATHQAGVRYYELRRGVAGGPFTVNEQATFAPDADNRWMGSSAMDNQGNLAVGYSVSSTSTYPSIRYAGRLVFDPPGGLFQGEATLIAGEGVQTNAGSRWGDYSSLNVDPTDDCTFFYTQEYYQVTDRSPGTPPFGVNWQTRVGSFKFSQCAAPAYGTLTVNVTNCATGAPLPGASVIIDGNLYGATGATGSFSAKLPPGTYTVTVTAPGGFESSTTTAVVSDGATTVVTACVTPIPVIVSAGGTLVSESCPPPNNVPDPGETVTVSLALTNNGQVSTTDLVATLLPSANVVDPSGPQNYGAIPVGGTAARDFTFTAAGACGEEIALTLQLQDGPRNLGTVTFTFRLGGLTSGSVTATYGSGNIAVPIPLQGTVEVPISVPDVGVASDINVRVRLNHTWDADLDLFLVAPDGTAVELSSNNGGAGDNYGSGPNDCSGAFTIFDDAAASPITAGVPPYVGTFRPEQPLSTLNGKSTEGTWRLRVVDEAPPDGGTVGCVQLEISRRQFFCCGTPGTPIVGTVPPPVIVGESCPPPNGAPDPGETVTVGLTLINNGTGGTTDLVATLLPSANVLSPSGPQNYGAVAPTASASRDFTFTAAGTCGETITLTLQLQDGVTDLGTATFTLRLGTTQQLAPTSFTNPAPIAIPTTGGTAGSAAPYPSSIAVSGLTGTVGKVTVTLNNLSHTWVDDVDLLLVGPTGQKMILMSDAGDGATYDLVNATLIFDDAAAAAVPDEGVIPSNATTTYRPSDYAGGLDAFPPPAPPPPYASALSAFNGTDPNGTWSLYAIDEFLGDAGFIAGGWSLSITTEIPVCTANCGGALLGETLSLSGSADFSVWRRRSPWLTSAR